jgi:hypothetical protein
MRFVWGNNDLLPIPLLNGWCDGRSESCHGGWSEPSTPDIVAFYTSPGYTGDQFSALVTHELGHKFVYKYGYVGVPSSWNDRRNNILNGPDVVNSEGQIVSSTWRHGSSTDWAETFPDMFTAWVFGEWNTSLKYASDVSGAIADMDKGMSSFR